MSVEIRMAATQVDPTTEASGTIQVDFEISGEPDSVQIYVGNGVDLSALRVEVPIVANKSNYSEKISDVIPGAVYTVFACPRFVQSDYVNGVYWETVCAAQPLVVKGIKRGGESRDRPAPVITSAVAFPATLGVPGHIELRWQADVKYDKFIIWWTENGEANGQGEVENGSSTTGTWSASTHPHRHYTFAVMGGQSTFWHFDYSGWGPVIQVDAAPPIQSVGQFVGRTSSSSDRQSTKALFDGQPIRTSMGL